MTATTAFNHDSFTFLSELADNNEKDWFNANKKRFKIGIEGPFIALLEALSNRLEDTRRPLSGGKSTIFRMNRDVRFSKDPSPYKTNMSGLLTPSGAKSQVSALVYMQMDKDGGFAASGYYNLSPKQLGPVRNAMVERAEVFDGVLEALAGAGRAFADYESLSSMPRGFAQHAEHRHAEHIKRQSLLVREELPKSAWLDGSVLDRVEQLARDTMPLLTFQDPAR